MSVMRHFCNTHPPTKQIKQTDQADKKAPHSKSVRRNTHGRLAVASTSVTAR
ncbi:hypothetical protein [Paraburkholderia bryophila]|uniref:Uncharacterized protein n=1 Tax=Paraburkholderia bryophila TaxID=420952 RepID=A0A7Y9W3Z4_9BURK|nr:hypothetical protein [Paraburkholderia bryophila]NYH13827.1 hypothetical protein [Paraburkholderia bryophila]